MPSGLGLFSQYPCYFHWRFPAVCLSPNSFWLVFGRCPSLAPDSVRIGDLCARISSPWPFSTAFWLAGLFQGLQAGSASSGFRWLAKFTRTCLGDYLFTPGVEFQGQSPQLATDMPRTPGREDFTWLSLSQASVPLPTEVKFSTCLAPKQVTVGWFSQSIMAPGPAPCHLLQDLWLQVRH